MHRKLSALMLGGILAVTEWTANSYAQTTVKRKTWDVLYEAGDSTAGVKRGASMKVSVEPGKILIEGKKSPSILIPVTQLASVTYDLTAESRARQAFSRADVLDVPSVAYMPLGLITLGLTAAVLAPFKSQKHYVNLIWSGGKDIHEVIVELKKNKYRPFLEEIQAITGKTWTDLPAARKKLRTELDAAKDKKIGIRLDRKVWVGNTILDPRSYQIVVLDREANRGEIYFFAGDSVNTNKIAAVTTIEIAAIDGIQTADVAYTEIDGLKTILSEIRVPGRTLKLQK